MLSDKKVLEKKGCFRLIEETLSDDSKVHNIEIVDEKGKIVAECREFATFQHAAMFWNMITDMSWEF